MARPRFSVLLLTIFCSSFVCDAQQFSSVNALPHAPKSANVPSIHATPVCSFLSFVGWYRPDGKFKRPSRHANSSYQYAHGDGIEIRPQVPEYIDVSSGEQKVENFQAGYHRSQQVKAPPVVAGALGNFIRFVYGRQNVLVAPTHLMTDSRGRLIVVDPPLNAVHVLDPTGRESFQISGGEHLQLQSPRGVALDREDNIYVADAKRGIILVFDPKGRYLRCIGRISGNEGMFERPDAVAIDRTEGLLYVVDPPANELVVLKLDGTIVHRLGGRNSSTRLVYPTGLALGKDTIVVLDQYGSHVQVLDRSGQPRTAFYVKPHDVEPSMAETGVGVDSAGNIYLANSIASEIGIYSPMGRLIARISQLGGGLLQFSKPAGIWVDQEDHVYVADTMNSRLLVFRPTDPLERESTQ